MLKAAQLSSTRHAFSREDDGCIKRGVDTAFVFVFHRSQIVPRKPFRVIIDLLVTGLAQGHEVIDFIYIRRSWTVISSGTAFREGDNVRTVSKVARLFGEVMFK